MRCAVWNHLYNLKNVKNTHREVLLLVKWQAKACSFTNSNTPPWVFFTLFKLCNWYQIAQSILFYKCGLEEGFDSGVHNRNLSEKIECSDKKLNKKITVAWWFITGHSKSTFLMEGRGGYLKSERKRTGGRGVSKLSVRSHCEKNSLIFETVNSVFSYLAVAKRATFEPSPVFQYIRVFFNVFLMNFKYFYCHCICNSVNLLCWVYKKTHSFLSFHSLIPHPKIHKRWRTFF